MNRELCGRAYTQPGVPRVSGDEPIHRTTAHAGSPCSPRERG